MEFATLRAAQNIVVLPYYSTLPIQMQLHQQRNGRKKYDFVNSRSFFAENSVDLKFSAVIPAVRIKFKHDPHPTESLHKEELRNGKG